MILSKFREKFNFDLFSERKFKEFLTDDCRKMDFLKVSGTKRNKTKKK